MQLSFDAWFYHHQLHEFVDLAKAFPGVSIILDHFGVDRCMFESNFPVDKESCSYSVLWNAFKKLCLSKSESEKSALFHDTAARVYRLGSE